MTRVLLIELSRNFDSTQIFRTYKMTEFFTFDQCDQDFFWSRGDRILVSDECVQNHFLSRRGWNSDEVPWMTKDLEKRIQEQAISSTSSLQAESSFRLRREIDDDWGNLVKQVFDPSIDSSSKSTESFNGEDSYTCDERNGNGQSSFFKSASAPAKRNEEDSRKSMGFGILRRLSQTLKPILFNDECDIEFFYNKTSANSNPSEY